MKNYQEFLESKKRTLTASGITVSPEELHADLFPFQRDIVRWALAKGKAALFLGTGLGKTFMQLEWSKQIAKHTGGSVLIVAPLAVAQQTIAEGFRFGIYVRQVRNQEQVKPQLTRISITNYEMLEHFDLSQFTAVVLDESSILKSHTSKTRKQIVDACEKVPYRLACTATPAPNDHMELANHAEFVGVMKRAEMLSCFFIHDGGEVQKWRLKKHAQVDFWRWVASWAVMMTRPQDLGYEGDGYLLPPLHVEQVTVKDQASTERLEQADTGVSLTLSRELRQLSIKARCEAAAELVKAQPNESWVVWCDLNDESKTLTRLIPGAVEVAGQHSIEYKEKAFKDFSEGRVKVLVTKPSIAGFGMNWQHCAQTVFVGLSYSFEAYYQAVRRFYRFGQEREVHAYVVTSESEGAVVDSVKAKEARFAEMLSGMISATQELTAQNIQSTGRNEDVYSERVEKGEGWEMHLGDCTDTLKRLPSDSVGLSVFSPPFMSLYTYSNSTRDLGNCSNRDEFVEHFKFIISELFRVTMPGRHVTFHCTQLSMSKEKFGVIGVQDFRGLLIRLFQEAGFVYHSEVAIWKNPVVEMQRTKALGLLHKTIKKDSAMSRMGFADYLVAMRKPGDNPQPITHTQESFPVGMWQQFASPVWADINPSDTLQYRSARDNNDEKHICPLQLPVIERSIALWSNPGDVVLSPFAGIGSEGWKAIEMGRRFIGMELKESYFNAAVTNLRNKENTIALEGTKTACPVFHVFKNKESFGVRAQDPAPVEVEETEEQEAA